ncbi:unnamed protein product [Effrenium voratum]|uniref:PDZ domain-containing protein n=1 Tax=Effrenium voratum TaxID=2562239 RepID=A0AA36IRJ2_9DINO|nr:unnamed protein product [Effrenium voratum]
MEDSHAEQVLTVDGSVNSLGLVFVALPPLPPPPMVVKQVHQGTWADSSGIQPGFEVLELGGLKVGSMTREEFQVAIKSRPLRIRVQAPHSEAWRRVAHFQRETVRLHLKKALLQKALRDEHEKVKLELGIDAKTEEERRAKNRETRAEIATQRQRLEEQKAALGLQQEELQKAQQQLEVLDQQTQSRRKKLELDKLQFSQQQEELAKARHDFDASRKSTLEAIEKEKLQIASERRKLQSSADEASMAEQEREELDEERRLIDVERQEVAQQRDLFEAEKRQLQLQLEEQQRLLERQRAEMEEDEAGMARQREELLAQKSRAAQLAAQCAEQEAALAQQKARGAAEAQSLAEAKAEAAELRKQLEKEKAEFEEKSKKTQQTLLAHKKQLMQVKNRLAAEKEKIEAAKADLETARAAQLPAAVSSAAQTETTQVIPAAAQTELGTCEAAVQTEALPVDNTENTDPPGALPEPPELPDPEPESVVQRSETSPKSLRSPNLVASQDKLRSGRSSPFQEKAETRGNQSPSSPSKSPRFAPAPWDWPSPRNDAAGTSPESRTAASPRRLKAAASMEELPQSEESARKVLASSSRVRRLLAQELPLRSSNVPKGPPRRGKLLRSASGQ